MEEKEKKKRMAEFINQKVVAKETPAIKDKMVVAPPNPAPSDDTQSSPDQKPPSRVKQEIRSLFENAVIEPVKWSILGNYVFGPLSGMPPESLGQLAKRVPSLLRFSAESYAKERGLGVANEVVNKVVDKLPFVGGLFNVNLGQYDPRQTPEVRRYDASGLPMGGMMSQPNYFPDQKPYELPKEFEQEEEKPKKKK